jgi:integrase
MRKRPGSVIWRADKGIFEVRVSLGKGADGKPRRKSLTSPGPKNPTNEKAAYQLLSKMLLQYGDGSAVETNLPTLGAWLEAFLANQTDLAQNTKDRKAGHLTHIKAHSIGQVRLDQLNADLLEEFYRFLVAPKPHGKAHAKATLTKLHQFIGEGYKKAIRRYPKTLTVNHVELADLPRAPESTPGQAIPPEHQAAILKAASTHRLYALVYCTLKLGLRRGEALGIRWEDVRFEPINGAAGLVTISRAIVPTKHQQVNIGATKTIDSDRMIPLSTAVVEVLKAHREKMRLEGQDVDKGWVFPSLNQTPLQPNNYNRLYDNLQISLGFFTIQERAGEDGKVYKYQKPLYRMHDLRVTSETEMMKRTKNPRLVATFHGQRSVVTAVKHYHRVTSADLAQAVMEDGDVAASGDKKEKSPAD